MNWESFDLDNLRADAIHTQVEDFDYGPFSVHCEGAIQDYYDE